jgi:hypothetical protein
MAFLTARIVMVIMMVGTVVAAYVADEPHFACKMDQSMTFLWRNHQTRSSDHD